MASSTRTWKYDVFPSFSGEDVRKSFLSHLLKALDRKLSNTFRDHGIERSRPIGPELVSAIRESRISIVVFSKMYASSTWCLNELVEIHKCYEELDQMVIPVFYDIDPSHVRKQTGEFGKAFEKSCKRKTKDEKQKWIRALAEVANMAGYDSRNWSDEADMIESIANDVSNKLITPSDEFGDFVGIEAHLETLKSMLCLESGGVRMVGIVGPSGIGKSTIARALFSRLSSQYHHRAFVTYKRTNQDVYGMKLAWEEQFLSEILCQKDIKVYHLGAVEQRLKHKKVLVVIDDVDDLELLNTLVGQTKWVGLGSRIIVVTQDRQHLKSHKIDLVYEVDFPSKALALQMFCRSTFGQNSPPEGFIELVFDVVKLAGNLPLGLNVMGLSLRGRDKEEWVEMMPSLRNSLNGKIEKTLRLSYDCLNAKYKDLFLYIACFFNGQEVNYIKDLLGDSVNIGLKVLAEKSLIHITPSRRVVKMHSLLQQLGREIVYAESINNPGKRRFLVDAEDVCDVFIDNSGTETVLAIYLDTSKISERFFIDEKSFKGMHNLQFLKIFKERWDKNDKVRLHFPRGLVHLPRKLKLLYWHDCPLKFMPSNFRAEYLVELTMVNSNLEKWEGTQSLRSLKKMNLSRSRHLKEIPDLSNAINLEELYLIQCTSLVALTSSVRKLNKLRELSMEGCTNLKVLPPNVNLESLDYLDLNGCSRLKTFPRISKNLSRLFLDGTAIKEEDFSWIVNISRLTEIQWRCSPVRNLPFNFHPEYLVELATGDCNLKELWEGSKPLPNLKKLTLNGSKNLKLIPDLSKATSLERLDFSEFTSLVQSLGKLRKYFIKFTKFGFLKNGVHMESLNYTNLSGCSRLRSFSQILWNKFIPDGTATEEEEEDFVYNCCPVRCMPSNFHPEYIVELTMRGSKLEKLWEGIQSLRNLIYMDLSGSENLKEIPDLSKATNLERLELSDCKSLVMLPSSMRNLNKLKMLNMKGCTRLEVLPTNINLVSLLVLDLSGCSLLKCFPQISTNITDLSLDHTSIEEVPYSIENISGLTKLTMSGCKMLKYVALNILILRRLTVVDFSGCGTVVDDMMQIW